MEIITNEKQAKEVLKDFNETALVPTMGNLHDGHHVNYPLWEQVRFH